ncbi:HNH endonuclease signature motif containing protein [Brevibacterium celere]|uniref:HNH endonuclease signature motif containing protein n=1 Tax=Brevibacterium TaxID=1696 RepID=UPI000DE9418E
MGNYKGPLDRLLAKTRRVDSGCLEFTGARSSQGYGFVRINGKNLYAHRVSYQLQVGPIPDGMVIDHLCRNTSCVEPTHLESVTPQENTLRGVSIQANNARKTHCLRGHPFEGDNLRIDTTGRRICRTCKRETQRRLRSRNG